MLLSNIPGAGAGARSAEQILRTYKEEQHAIEKNSGFLKDDLIVLAHLAAHLAGDAHRARSAPGD